ncbi:MAG TPA: dihydroorotate dehydrogenase electron transfer subunit [Burkholderiales bacterium]|nr:dihydroorotate dehydrogenase electron transfer subunit [Burkholderiales bacterium]
MSFEQVLAPVVFNRHLTGDYWLIEAEAPSIAGRLSPGQFVNVRIEGSLVPYLRRPFSVYRLTANRRRLQVAYKLQGEGTRLMKSTMPQGRACDLVGPFGRGFRLPERAKRIAVVGRGIGIAALPTLVDEAAARGIEVHGFLSARTRPNLVALDIFASYGFPVSTHTDDASSGLVTDHLVALAEKRDFDAFYVCGSNRLARAVHALAARTGALAEIAMEQHMACGFGDCHGCVIRVNLDAGGREKAFREVCHYGPVFDTWEIVDASA